MFLGTKISYELIKDPHKEVRHVNKAFPRNFELGDGWEVVYLSICFQTTDYSCSAHSRLLRSLRVKLWCFTRSCSWLCVRTDCSVRIWKRDKTLENWPNAVELQTRFSRTTFSRNNLKPLGLLGGISKNESLHWTHGFPSFPFHFDESEFILIRRGQCVNIWTATRCYK